MATRSLTWLPFVPPSCNLFPVESPDASTRLHCYIGIRRPGWRRTQLQMRGSCENLRSEHAVPTLLRSYIVNVYPAELLCSSLAFIWLLLQVKGTRTPS